MCCVWCADFWVCREYFWYISNKTLQNFFSRHLPTISRMRCNGMCPSPKTNDEVWMLTGDFWGFQMVFVCHDRCNKFTQNGVSNKKSYENGFKWCSCCCEYLRFEGLRCPCCNITLRSGPKIKVQKWSRLVCSSLALSHNPHKETE